MELVWIESLLLGLVPAVAYALVARRARGAWGTLASDGPHARRAHYRARPADAAPRPAAVPRAVAVGAWSAFAFGAHGAALMLVGLRSMREGRSGFELVLGAALALCGFWAGRALLRCDRARIGWATTLATGVYGLVWLVGLAWMDPFHGEHGRLAALGPVLYLAVAAAATAALSVLAVALRAAVDAVDVPATRR